MQICSIGTRELSKNYVNTRPGHTQVAQATDGVAPALEDVAEVTLVAGAA